MHGDRTRDQVGDDTTDDALDGDEVICPKCAGSFSPQFERCPDDGAKLIRLAPERDPMLGTVVDKRFRIVRSLGQGGMGMVYEAIQIGIDRPVAIKVIKDTLSRDRTTAKRFLREARLLTSFDHPNIVNVRDFGQTDSGALYLVMELLRGNTLADELDQAERFSPRRTCEVAIQLCDALAAAHARGIVHRDLKPVNIVIVDAPVRDQVKVLDFGLAKSLTGDNLTTTTLTQAGAILGTPLYMAPEAVSGMVEPRTDLYALGCIMYELLTGEAPFVDPAINVVLARHLSEPPRPLPEDVPAPIASLVIALLAKSAEQRPPSADYVRTRLQAFLDHDAYDDGGDKSDDVTLIHPSRPPQPTHGSRPSHPAHGSRPSKPSRPPQPVFGSRPPQPVQADGQRATIRGVPPVPHPAARTSIGPPGWSRLEKTALVIGLLAVAAMIVLVVWLYTS